MFDALRSTWQERKGLSLRLSELKQELIEAENALVEARKRAINDDSIARDLVSLAFQRGAHD